LTSCNVARDQVAYWAFKGHDYTRARMLWEPQAQAGEPIAEFDLGYLYERGLGVTRDESAAAYANDRYAELNLGFMYLYGLGLHRDPVEAEEWIEKAANGGYTFAIKVFALLYSPSQGCFLLTGLESRPF